MKGDRARYSTRGQQSAPLAVTLNASSTITFRKYPAVPAISTSGGIPPQEQGALTACQNPN